MTQLTLDQFSVESVITGAPAIEVLQVSVEAIISPAVRAVGYQSVVEVLYRNIGVRLDQLSVEAILPGVPTTRGFAYQNAVEVLMRPAPGATAPTSTTFKPN